VISSDDLKPGKNVTFGSDRFNRSNKAVYLNQGYLTMPPGVYFSGDFSVVAWVKVMAILNGSPRLIDLSPNKVLVAITCANNANPCTIVGTSSTKKSNTTITIGKWFHLTLKLKGSSLSMFINGLPVLNSNSISPPANITRTSNFVGRSSYPLDNDAYAYFDEIKFYNRALSQNEIITDLNLVEN
jgi:hypothetical protein